MNFLGVSVGLDKGLRGQEITPEAERKCYQQFRRISVPINWVNIVMQAGVAWQHQRAPRSMTEHCTPQPNPSGHTPRCISKPDAPHCLPAWPLPAPPLSQGLTLPQYVIHNWHQQAVAVLDLVQLRLLGRELLPPSHPCTCCSKYEINVIMCVYHV